MRDIILILVKSKDLLAEITRFITTGGLNTLLTFALYQFLVTFMTPEVSYAIAWVTGFIFIAIAYPKYVFRGNTSTTRQIAILLALYLSSFSVGLLLMWLSVQWFIHERLSVIIVIIITATINYTFAKRIFRKNNILGYQ